MSSQNLPLVLQDRVPTNPQDKFVENSSGGFYMYDSYTAQFKFNMRTPNGSIVPVWGPDYTDCTRPRKRGQPINGDNLYNCVAHAMGTWSPDKRVGYLIDSAVGLWPILNDPGLATTIMAPSGTLDPSVPPLQDDILVFWDKQPLNGPLGTTVRPACHAVKLVTPVVKEKKLDEQTMVDTKNGQNAPEKQTIKDMLEKNADYQGKTWAIYRLKKKTVIAADQKYDMIV